MRGLLPPPLIQSASGILISHSFIYEQKNKQIKKQKRKLACMMFAIISSPRGSQAAFNACNLPELRHLTKAPID